MKRRKNNKRVLIPRNNRQSYQRRQKRNNNPFVSRRQPRNNRRSNNKQKTNGMLVFLMIIALIGFVLGAGVGVSLNLEDSGDDEGPHYQNVTKEMTNNLSESKKVSYDSSVDGVDFNENQTSGTNNVSYV